MNKWLLWFFRLIAAGVLMPVGSMKLFGDDMSVLLFDLLGMEPHGRIIVGVIEVTAALLLLSPQSAIGALIAVGIMFGAIIAHITVLGVQVGGDGGRLVMMLVLVFASSAVVFIAQRRDLPIVGSTLDSTGSDAPS
jgi:putative oxidoreductase